MENELNGQDYRKIAMKIERDLQELIAYAEKVEEVPIPIVGDLYLFPRLSPEISTLEHQLSLAQEKASEAIAIFNTLAELKDAEKRKEDVIAPVPALLVSQMETQVESFIKYYQIKKDTKSRDPQTQSRPSTENNKPEQ